MRLIFARFTRALGRAIVRRMTSRVLFRGRIGTSNPIDDVVQQVDEWLDNAMNIIEAFELMA